MSSRSAFMSSPSEISRVGLADWPTRITLSLAALLYFSPTPFDRWAVKVTAEVLRYLLLATHYRSPLDFSDAGLMDAKRALDNFYDLFLRLGEQEGEKRPGDHIAAGAIERFKREFHQGMDDDFNTPMALAEFQRLRTELNKSIEAGLSKSMSTEARETFRTFGGVLGLFDMAGREWQFTKSAAASFCSSSETRQESSDLAPDEIEQLLDERREARQKKNFKRADEIRESLLQQGITIEDRPDGTSRWKR